MAYGSTLLISIAPFLLLFLFRVENTPAHRNYLRIALSFASGGLLGDAFIHLIPHAISPHHHHEDDHGHGHEHEHHGHDHAHHDHGHDHHHHEEAGHSHAHHHHEEHGHSHAHEHHDHGHGHAHPEHDHFQQTMVGLYIVLGVIFFFLMEKFIMFLKEKSGSGHGHSHSHGHSHGGDSKKKTKKPKKAKVSDDESSDVEEDSALIQESSGSKNKVVSGLLNLIADFLHNFTDGLAIGATFATGKSMGAVTAFSIFMHEIPHEIGDYAILIQAGYKRSSAISLQLVTALGAFLGTMVGLHFGTFDKATALILPLTAGGFIYIATVSVIPELLEKANSYLHAFLELLALLTGVAMMFFIALYE